MRIIILFILISVAGLAQQTIQPSGGSMTEATRSFLVWVQANGLFKDANGNVAIGGTTLRGGGTSLPGTCAVGDQYFLTTGTTGNYQCTSTNTWSLPGSGGGSTTVNGQSCAIGGSCTVTADPASAQYKVRTCEVIIGDPGAGSAALADDNDSPAVCGNKTGATLTITAVECYANAGSPTVTPIITGGGAILTGALTCGTGSFAAGTLSGTPTQSNGGSIDANITTAGGTAKYVVIRITRTL